MNKKERFLAAVNFKGVDRIPTSYRGIDFVSESLLKYFKINEPENLLKNYKELIKAMGADFWSSGSKIGKFTTYIPGYSGPPPEQPYIDDGLFLFTLGIKSKIGKVKKYNYQYPNIGVEPPLANIENASDINKDFLTTKLKLFDFRSYTNKYKNRYGNTDLSYESIKKSDEDFICIGSLNCFFMICSYLRGMDKFLMDLVSNKKLAEFLISEVGEFCLEFSKQELLNFGKRADYYSGWDDVAGQSGMLFSPEIFKKYFLPLYKRLIANVKKEGLVFNWHCCGSVHSILPCMIDAGIDIFDVVQTSAKDMELEKMFKMYGKIICMHGGIDVQKLLIFGSKKDIENEVKKVIGLWGNNGGIILAPSHEVLPETPIENILTIFNTVNKLS